MGGGGGKGMTEVALILAVLAIVAAVLYAVLAPDIGRFVHLLNVGERLSEEVRAVGIKR